MTPGLSHRDQAARNAEPDDATFHQLYGAGRSIFTRLGIRPLFQFFCLQGHTDGYPNAPGFAS